MNKSKVRIILNTITGGVIALCMLICINTPELFKAEIIGFTNPLFTTYYYNQGQKFMGNSIQSGSTTWNFYSYPGRIDNSNINMAFDFRIGMSGPTLPEYANLYGKSYSLRFSFGCKTLNDGEVFGFNTNEIQSYSCVVTYTDGSVQDLRCDYVITSPTTVGGNYTVNLELSGFQDKLISFFNFSVYFNFHYAFTVPTDFDTINSMDMFVSSITGWSNITPVSPPLNDIPSFELPETDVNGLPVLDDFMPESDVGFFKILELFTSQQFVLIPMLIVCTVGVVGYVIFGKR